MNKILASLKSERTLLAALLGAAAAWLMREPFTALLFAGRSFAGRAMPMQALILSALFLAWFCFLFLIAGRALDALIADAGWAAAVLALVPVAAFAVMGSFSRFVSDDFSSAVLASRLGVWGGAVDWYLHWTGRFSANLVDSLTGALGQKAVGWQAPIVLALWLPALTLTAVQLLPADGPRRKWTSAIFLAGITLTAAFQASPDLPQSLYWAQGMHSLVLPLLLATVMAAALLWLGRQQTSHPLWVILMGILAFVAGGFGETYVCLQTLALGLVLAAGLVFRREEFSKKLLAAVAVALAGSVVAMMVVVLAPGNAARQANFPPPPALPAMLGIALHAFWIYLTDLFGSLVKIEGMAALFAMAAAAGSGLLDWKSDRPHRLRSTLPLILIVTLGLMYACFVPSAYGMSTTPPGRTLVIPTFLLAFGLAAAGFLVGQALARRVLPKWTGSAHVIIWILFLAFTAQIFFTTRGILSLLPEYSRFARVSDQVDDILWDAKAQGLDSVEIPEVHNHFGLSDFGAGTNEWLDDAVNKYYGLRVVINKNLNKRFK